jgi:hypothetical protein
LGSAALVIGAGSGCISWAGMTGRVWEELRPTVLARPTSVRVEAEEGTVGGEPSIWILQGW